MNKGGDYVSNYYGIDRRRYIQHFGTKGMKWGYYDGSRNGKRTARKEEYEKEQLKYAMKAGNAEANRNLEEEKKNYEQYYNADKEYDNYMEKAKIAEENKNTASSIDYMLGYSVGKIKSEFGKQINKAKDWFSKMFN